MEKPKSLLHKTFSQSPNTFVGKPTSIYSRVGEVKVSEKVIPMEIVEQPTKISIARPVSIQDPYRQDDLYRDSQPYRKTLVRELSDHDEDNSDDNHSRRSKSNKKTFINLLSEMGNDFKSPHALPIESQLLQSTAIGRNSQKHILEEEQQVVRKTSSVMPGQRNTIYSNVSRQRPQLSSHEFSDQDSVENDEKKREASPDYAKHHNMSTHFDKKYQANQNNVGLEQRGSYADENVAYKNSRNSGIEEVRKLGLSHEEAHRYKDPKEKGLSRERLNSQDSIASLEYGSNNHRSKGHHHEAEPSNYQDHHQFQHRPTDSYHPNNQNATRGSQHPLENRSQSPANDVRNSKAQGFNDNKSISGYNQNVGNVRPSLVDNKLFPSPQLLESFAHMDKESKRNTLPQSSNNRESIVKVSIREPDHNVDPRQSNVKIPSSDLHKSMPWNAEQDQAYRPPQKHSERDSRMLENSHHQSHQLNESQKQPYPITRSNVSTEKQSPLHDSFKDRPSFESPDQHRFSNADRRNSSELIDIIKKLKNEGNSTSKRPSELSGVNIHPTQNAPHHPSLNHGTDPSLSARLPSGANGNLAISKNQNSQIDNSGFHDSKMYSNVPMQFESRMTGPHLTAHVNNPISEARASREETGKSHYSGVSQPISAYQLPHSNIQASELNQQPNLHSSQANHQNNLRNMTQSYTPERTTNTLRDSFTHETNKSEMHPPSRPSQPEINEYEKMRRERLSKGQNLAKEAPNATPLHHSYAHNDEDNLNYHQPRPSKPVNAIDDKRHSQSHTEHQKHHLGRPHQESEVQRLSFYNFDEPEVVHYMNSNKFNEDILTVSGKGKGSKINPLPDASLKSRDSKRIPDQATTRSSFQQEHPHSDNKLEGSNRLNDSRLGNPQADSKQKDSFALNQSTRGKNSLLQDQNTLPLQQEPLKQSNFTLKESNSKLPKDSVDFFGSKHEKDLKHSGQDSSKRPKDNKTGSGEDLLDLQFGEPLGHVSANQFDRHTQPDTDLLDSLRQIIDGKKVEINQRPDPNARGQTGSAGQRPEKLTGILRQTARANSKSSEDEAALERQRTLSRQTKTGNPLGGDVKSFQNWIGDKRTSNTSNSDVRDQPLPKQPPALARLSTNANRPQNLHEVFGVPLPPTHVQEDSYQLPKTLAKSDMMDYDLTQQSNPRNGSADKDSLHFIHSQESRLQNLNPNNMENLTKTAIGKIDELIKIESHPFSHRELLDSRSNALDISSYKTKEVGQNSESGHKGMQESKLSPRDSHGANELRKSKPSSPQSMVDQSKKRDSMLQDNSPDKLLKNSSMINEKGFKGMAFETHTNSLVQQPLTSQVAKSRISQKDDKTYMQLSALRKSDALLKEDPASLKRSSDNKSPLQSSKVPLRNSKVLTESALVGTPKSNLQNSLVDQKQNGSQLRRSSIKTSEVAKPTQVVKPSDRFSNPPELKSNLTTSGMINESKILNKTMQATQNSLVIDTKRPTLTDSTKRISKQSITVPTNPTPIASPEVNTPIKRPSQTPDLSSSMKPKDIIPAMIQTPQAQQKPIEKPPTEDPSLSRDANPSPSKNKKKKKKSKNRSSSPAEQKTQIQPPLLTPENRSSVSITPQPQLSQPTGPNPPSLPQRESALQVRESLSQAKSNFMNSGMHNDGSLNTTNLQTLQNSLEKHNLVQSTNPKDDKKLSPNQKSITSSALINKDKIPKGSSIHQNVVKNQDPTIDAPSRTYLLNSGMTDDQVNDHQRMRTMVNSIAQGDNLKNSEILNYSKASNFNNNNSHKVTPDPLTSNKQTDSKLDALIKSRQGQDPLPKAEPLPRAKEEIVSSIHLLNSGMMHDDSMNKLNFKAQLNSLQGSDQFNNVQNRGSTNEFLGSSFAKKPDHLGESSGYKPFTDVLKDSEPIPKRQTLKSSQNDKEQDINDYMIATKKTSVQLTPEDRRFSKVDNFVRREDIFKNITESEPFDPRTDQGQFYKHSSRQSRDSKADATLGKQLSFGNKNQKFEEPIPERPWRTSGAHSNPFLNSLLDSSPDVHDKSRAMESGVPGKHTLPKTGASDDLEYLRGLINNDSGIDPRGLLQEPNPAQSHDFGRKHLTKQNSLFYN